MAYLVLPPRLAQQFHAQLGFYASTVSPLDQLALARFIESGSYERHVNRLRTRARKTQDALVGALREHLGSSVSFTELNNGLHFIIQLESKQSEAALANAALEHGIRIAPLSQFDESGSTGTANVSSSGNTTPAAPPPAVHPAQRRNRRRIRRNHSSRPRKRMGITPTPPSATSARKGDQAARNTQVRAKALTLINNAQRARHCFPESGASPFLTAPSKTLAVFAARYLSP